LNIRVIVGKASEGTLEEKEVISYSETNRISLDEFAHDFSRNVAQNYFDGVYDFSFSDSAMNWLYGFLTDPTYLENNGNAISEFPLNVYLAFDAGEYHHYCDDDSVDPILEYTDPAIEKVLSGKNS